MTTTEYLEQLSYIDSKIEHKLREARQWYDLAMGIGGGASENKVQTSPNLDKMGSAVVNYIDYWEEATKMARELSMLKRTIIRQIDGLGNSLHYNILYGKFLEKKNFTQLAEENCYSAKQIKRHYYCSLDEFEEKYGEEYLKLSV